MLVRNSCLALSRFVLSGWVCAAVLFVVTTVQEVGSPKIEAATKSHLADLRFPTYYKFGFPLLITGFVACAIGCRTPEFGKLRARTVPVLAALSVVLMLIDYVWIYGPLREMTADPLAARPAAFVSYHQASMQINGLLIMLALIAAAAVSWPRKS